MADAHPPSSSASHTTHFDLDAVFTYPAINDRGYDLLHQIASIYETGEPPEQSTLLMDGTYSMMARSHQRTCATELSAPLPLPIPLENASTALDGGAPAPGLHQPSAPTFQECRKCSGKYVFQLPRGTDKVTIIGGAPKASGTQTMPYKTMSYVWGNLPSSSLSIPCLHCGHITSVPMLSVQRFHNLMSLGGAGNTIWLDALSIDQTSKEDVAENIGMMGTIYKNATCVSVLLPASDKAAYECLKAIERDAKVILMRRQNFINNSDFTFHDPTSNETINVLTTVCQMFLENLKNLGEHLHQFQYWSRAWTFQEWALASDLEIAVEGWSTPDTCLNIKSLVLGASMLISRYKILQHQYAEIKLGETLSRGMIPPIFNNIKAIFPDEDLFLSYEEVDGKKTSFQANFPHVGITDLLGIRSIPAPSMPPASSSSAELSTPHALALSARPTQLAQTRARLILLLSVFASSKRSAKYEADLVACWASMCNIVYPYDRTDDFSTAKRKAVNALREQGLVVYDFVPDTWHFKDAEGVTGPVDIFRVYAREHPQLNATNNAEFPGAPMFTGRADTVLHIIYSLNNINLPTQWINNGSADTRHSQMRAVPGSKIVEVIALDGDLGEATTRFAKRAMYGRIPGLAGFQFWDTQDVAKLYLEKVPAERRAMAKLVVAQIQFYKHHDSTPPVPCDLYLWGIVPIDVEPKNLSVYREPVNGTLMLSLPRNGRHHIVSYLVLSDHLSGTFLVRTDHRGKVDLELRMPERGDIMHSTYRQVAVRRLWGEVKLESGGGTLAE